MSGILGGIFGQNHNAASLPSNTAPATGHAPGQVYSFARLQQLYDRLLRVREPDLERPAWGDSLVEIIRQLTEVLLWGEVHDPRMFDFFCEKNILADFVKVLGLPKAPKKVKLQLLQTLQMLIQNIRQETSMYYLMSNNHMNRLMSMKFDFNDEEILAYYITLMKSLSLRLDTETVKFFFIQRPEVTTFPLYTEATKFFGHHDQMVRAAARTITLQVYRLQDSSMQDFVLRHASEAYFGELALQLRDHWLRLDVAVGAVSVDKDFSAAQVECELQQDLQIYLSDIFELEVTALNEVLADRLLNVVMLPVLLAGICSARKVIDEGTERARRKLAPAVALFLLRQVLDTFRCAVLLEPVLTALLQPSMPAAMTYLLPHCWEARDAGSGQGDFVRNEVRRHFLGLLASGVEAHALLAAAVVHGCVQSWGKCFWEGDSCSSTPEASEEGAWELLAALVRALRFSASWQLCTLQVFVRIFLDIFLGPTSQRMSRSREALQSETRACLRLAMQGLVSALEQRAGACSPDDDDGFMDAFAEEWEQHLRPLPAVTAICGHPRCLRPAQQAKEQREGRHRGRIGAPLLLRRLMRTLERAPTAECPESENWTGRCEEISPLQLDDPGSGSVTEGQPFFMEDLPHIICGVATPQGKYTRFLVLHNSLFLLVQPDRGLPGQMVVKTTRPIWRVLAFRDRSEPRTLRLALPPRCSEKAEPGSPGETMSLNFKDVQSAHTAATHLQSRRQELCALLMQRTLKFATDCLEALPAEEQPMEEVSPDRSAQPSEEQEDVVCEEL